MNDGIHVLIIVPAFVVLRSSYMGITRHVACSFKHLLAELRTMLHARLFAAHLLTQTKGWLETIAA